MVRRSQINNLKKLLATKPPERLIQSFLEKNKEIVAAYLGVHAVYVVPQPRFSIHHIADFAVTEYNSAGPQWTLIELEPSTARPFNKNGRPSAKLINAIEQVKEWRRFVRNNQEHCRRPRAEGGLGLQGITERFWGAVVIGRRDDYKDEFEGWRKQHSEDLLIDILSYDRFLDLPTAISIQNSWRHKSSSKPHFAFKFGSGSHTKELSIPIKRSAKPK